MMPGPRFPELKLVRGPTCNRLHCFSSSTCTAYHCEPRGLNGHEVGATKITTVLVLLDNPHTGEGRALASKVVLEFC